MRKGLFYVYYFTGAKYVSLITNYFDAMSVASKACSAGTGNIEKYVCARSPKLLSSISASTMRQKVRIQPLRKFGPVEMTTADSLVYIFYFVTTVTHRPLPPATTLTYCCTPTASLWVISAFFPSPSSPSLICHLASAISSLKQHFKWVCTLSIFS